ncbi:MAG: anti-sigma factor [Pseudomonadota bacterium]|nr:anti-sigma factor [Pseudomonadota bacterium]
MIDQEQFEEICAAYCLGILNTDDRLNFEKILATATPEQRQAIDALMLAARHLPVSGKLVAPAPAVKERIMNQIGANKKINNTSLIEKIYFALKFDQPVVTFGMALILIVSTSVLYFRQIDLSGSVSDFEQKLSQLQQELKTQTEELSESKLKLTELENKSAENAQALADKDKELSGLKLASAQNQEFIKLMQAPDLKVTDIKGLKPTPKGRGKVMYSSNLKLAYIQLSNLPPAPTNKDYQLWMMDGKKAVSAGVLSLASDQSSILKVTTGLVVEVKRLSAFVITLEQKGGVPSAKGPMVMLGNVKI